MRSYSGWRRAILDFKVLGPRYLGLSTHAGDEQSWISGHGPRYLGLGTQAGDGQSWISSYVGT